MLFLFKRYPYWRRILFFYFFRCVQSNWNPITNSTIGLLSQAGREPWAMICLGWNCQDLGNPLTVHALKELEIAKKTSIIFINETLVDQNKIEEIKIVIAYDCCFYVDCLGWKGGLAMLWKNTAMIDIVGYSSSFIDAIINSCPVSWQLTGLYGCRSVVIRLSHRTCLLLWLVSHLFLRYT